MAKSRILHIIPSTSLYQGGPIYALKMLLKGLTTHDFSCTTATLKDKMEDFPSQNFLETPKNKVYYFNKMSNFYSFSPIFSYWLWNNVTKFDLIHIHGLFNFPCISAGIICNLRNVPFLITPHGMVNSRGMQTKKILKLISFNLFEKSILRQASAIHLTSKEEEMEFKLLNIEANTITIPLAVNSFKSLKMPKCNKNSLTGDQKLILFIGRIHPIKNLESLITAMGNESLSSFTLLICGEGTPNYKKKLISLSQNIGIESRIKWCGFADENKKLKLLNTCDMLVLPSFSESYAISAIEALSAGLPLVLTRGVANSSAFGDAGLASICDPCPNSIANGILEMADKKTVNFRKKAINYFSNNFNENLLSKKMADLYKEVVKTRNYLKQSAKL